MSAFEFSIILPAFLASVLVLSTHVPLGQEVLRRGIIFIDLAIAQVAGLGVIATDTMGWEARGFMVQITAVGAALIAAWVLNWTDRRWPEIQEALIGVVFVLAATAGILLLALSSPAFAEPQTSTRPAVTAGTELGQRAPDFTLARSDGGDYTLSAEAGAPRIVVFFRGTW